MPAGPIEDRLERRWVLEGRLHEPSDHRFVHSADGTAGVLAQGDPAGGPPGGATARRLNLGVYLETPTSVTMTPRCGGPSSTQRGTAPRRSAREQHRAASVVGSFPRTGPLARSHHKSNAAGSAALSERNCPAIRRRREVAGPTLSRTGGWVAISRPTTASSPAPSRSGWHDGCRQSFRHRGGWRSAPRFRPEVRREPHDSPGTGREIVRLTV